MSKKNNQKHLGYQDRKEIEHALDNRKKVSEIARELGVPASTVAREIKRNRKCKGYLAAVTKGNHCKHKRNCEVKNLCTIYCSKYCRSCRIKNCKDTCGSFAEQECSALANSPFCCNACQQKKDVWIQEILLLCFSCSWESQRAPQRIQKRHRHNTRRSRTHGAYCKSWP